MTSARETADVLLAAQAASGTRPARRRTSSAPSGAGVGPSPVAAAAAPLGEPGERGARDPLERPEDGDPRPNSPEDVGFSVSKPKGRPRPPTDREYLAALPGGAFVGCAPTPDPLFPWEAIVRRRDGRELAVYGKSEAEALGKLRAEVERLTGGAA